LAPSLLWGRLPGAFLGMLGLLGIFGRRRYPVDQRLRSLVSIRVAQLNGCHFCVDLNAYNFLKASGDEGKAAEVGDWPASERFTPSERAALAWAERVTSNCAEIDKKAVDELRMYYSDDEVTALTAWIGFQNMSAKFNASLGAEEHGFCDVRRTP
ncbi:MAG: carboxymuconolactone decarboxylase family protein, partial [Wenzhouxiangella sp.]|nr:carboxymuconolactone decarboxylase family protein [Wenzhouxiangella sp.]